MSTNPQSTQERPARLPIMKCPGRCCAIDHNWARPFSGLMSRPLASYRNNNTILITHILYSCSNNEKLMATKSASQQHNSKLELQPHLILAIVVDQGRQTS